MRPPLVRILFSTAALGSIVGGSYGIYKSTNNNFKKVDLTVKNSQETHIPEARKEDDSSEQQTENFEKLDEKKETHKAEKETYLEPQLNHEEDEKSLEFIPQKPQEGYKLETTKDEQDSHPLRRREESEEKDLSLNSEQEKPYELNETFKAEKSFSENSEDEQQSLIKEQEELERKKKEEERKAKYLKEIQEKDISLELTWMNRVDGSYLSKTCFLLSSKDSHEKIVDVVDESEAEEEDCDDIGKEQSEWSSDKKLGDSNEEGLWVRGEEDKVRKLFEVNFDNFSGSGYLEEKITKENIFSTPIKDLLSQSLCKNIEASKEKNNWIELECIISKEWLDKKKEQKELQRKASFNPTKRQSPSRKKKF